uniref:Avh318 n=1 Tax=Phytophthora sojae TaxID=67593 RepID=G1FSS3_PHYSO|nr:Avh318 [Phytophthora sojae]
MQNIMLVVVVYFAAVEALEIPTGPKITVPTHNSVGEARRLLRSREAAALDNTDNESSPDSDERGPRGSRGLLNWTKTNQDLSLCRP